MGKVILVTGGAGFIGSHLCERLVKEGHRVISLDNYFTGSRENHVPGVWYREGHTKDIEELIPETPDLVYHLGEYSRVEKSFEDVETVWDLNQAGTFAVLEFVRRRGAKIVYAGSSTKFSDGGLGRDQSPYAWSKAVNTELVKNYGEWFGIDYAITYFYNVYGPRERSDAFGTVIEIFRQSYLSGRPLGVVLPGTQTRNFTHVDDIVDGLLLVGEKGSGDEFGLGDARAYAISEVAKLFGGEIIMLPERPGNRLTSEVDTSKAHALGWQATRHLSDYIASCRQEGATKVSVPKRVLVFSTTFHPYNGPAEDALVALMCAMPDVTFDVVTAKFGTDAEDVCPVPNARVYRVGSGARYDRFLLPILGSHKARELMREHQYLVSWSVMASYAAAAAFLSRGTASILITLANQRLTWYATLFLNLFMHQGDQLYASVPEQSRHIAPLEMRMKKRKTYGSGDTFGNALRFAYANALAKRLRS